MFISKVVVASFVRFVSNIQSSSIIVSIWYQLLHLLQDKPMLDGRFPRGIDPGVVNGTHFMIIPSLEGMNDGSGMTGMNAISFHGHFARLKVLGIGRHLKGRKLRVRTILAGFLQRRDDELMKGSPRRCQGLILGATKFAHDPISNVGPRFHFRGMNQQRSCLVGGFVSNCFESFRATSVHDDSDAACFCQIQGNGPSKFGRGTGDEYFLGVFWNFLKNGSRRQGISVYHSHLELIPKLIDE
mmetsp:Transcript_18773/g.33111  ORF Transcript_18773/g.33111 Transcript_18773/m.33111 type:complete len:242 (+) Transcript_18773:209-934(+)